MGESSKKSGEVGETITKKLLSIIGWKQSIHNVSIKCNTAKHLNDKGSPKRTHGEDQIFLYDSPFHDDITEFIHISVKNTINKYPGSDGLKTKFKEYSNELYEIIECAEYSPELSEISNTFVSKKHRNHVGLLVYLQNDIDGIERNIRPDLANIRLEKESDIPIYLIDNARASFLLKIADYLKSNSVGGSYEFFYPQIGTSVSVESPRTGNYLPVELIASDVVPALITKNGVIEMIVFANESFDSNVYKQLIEYSLHFATGLVSRIKIGMRDFNSAQDEEIVQKVRMSFKDREELITPFCFKRSILDLYQE